MRLLRPALVCALALGLLACPAGADVVDTSAVSTDPAGAHVRLGRDGSWVEPGVRRGGSASAPMQQCGREWVPSPGRFALRRTGSGDLYPVPMDPAPGPEYVAYQVWYCGVYVASVWLRPQQFGADPRTVAEQVVRDLPYPAATVGANPAGRGLTGLTSWFWVEGYTGAPIVDAVRELGMTVTVEATPSSVDWDFGDDTIGRDLGLGVAPPGRATVGHAYETRGTPAFRVRVLVRLAVRWRLGSGPWQPLAPVVRTAVLDYPVVSTRAALVPDGWTGGTPAGSRAPGHL
jgi:hypothetical protein